MNENKVVFGWQDNPAIGVALDKIAQDYGISRSDLIRIIIRDKIKAELAQNIAWSSSKVKSKNGEIT
jgi:metal-responsive CopG/Arc/MetJ family transcriptional regulator